MKIDTKELAEDVFSYINSEVDSVIVLRLLSTIKVLGDALENADDLAYSAGHHREGGYKEYCEDCKCAKKIHNALQLIEPLKPLFKEQPND